MIGAITQAAATGSFLLRSSLTHLEFPIMAFIVGISGSLRHGSFNSGLLRAAAELMPEGVTLEIAGIHDIPLYNGDVEASQGMPAAVTQLKERIAASSGIVLATPEYNGSIPGVLKNTIDWLSRPPADTARIFSGRPIAIMGASPGGFGTSGAQAAWLPIIRTLSMRPWFEGRLMVSKATALFDAEGQLIDAKTRTQVQAFMQGFVQFAVAAKTT